MLPNTLPLLRCPSCQKGALEITRQSWAGAEIWEGELLCLSCPAVYPILDGMPRLHVDAESWAPKSREAGGWVAIHKLKGIYEQDEDAIDLQVPYYPADPWISVARSFDHALARLNLTGSETILDLGAGRGWAAKQFALLGCRAFALDVVADENIGLGRAKVLMEHAGIHFERLIADGENLPLQPESFDIVFCCGSLHHTSNLPLLMSNIHRVLKPGGRLCAINEPYIHILKDEAQVLAEVASEEIELGINENRPNIVDYFSALRASGFTVEIAAPAVTLEMRDVDKLELARNLDATWPELTIRRPRHIVRRLYHYYLNHTKALFKGGLAYARVPPFLSAEQKLAYRILLWSDLELFLLVAA